MENIKLFDLLPNGVILFKNKKITYINQHLLNVLNIDFLDLQSAVSIMLNMLKMKNEKSLFKFFTTNDYFIHNSKIVQIAHIKHGDNDIFSFMAIYQSLISKEFEKKKSKKSPKINIDKKVAKYFKINDIKKIMVLTFYKGLPLKNFADIIQITEESIKISVDSKHQISLLEKNDILLLSNTKAGSSVLHGHVVKNKENIFTIEDFVLVKDDKHLRKGIRVTTSEDIIVLLGEKEFLVYDISDKGISITINDALEELSLKTKASITIILNSESIRLDVHYLKTIYNDEGKELRVLFKILSIEKDYLKIHDYISKKQNEIIREIHRYQTDI